jgi:ketosteroid isomerase-like protein
MFWMEGSQTFRGRAEVRGWFDQILEPWENLKFEAGEIREASGDRLFAEFILTASGRESGAETRLHFWTLSRIADGLIAKRQV